MINQNSNRNTAFWEGNYNTKQVLACNKATKKPAILFTGMDEASPLTEVDDG